MFTFLMHPGRLSLTCLLLVVLVAVTGCLHAEEPAPGGDGAETVDTRDLAKGQHSGHHDEDRRVIDDPEEWAEFWEVHTQDQMPGEDRPEVDFSSERVVAVLLGERPNGCHHVRITNVTQEEGRTGVTLTQYVPTPGAVCTDVIVHPYHFIAVPADGTEVVFEDREREGTPSQT